MVSAYDGQPYRARIVRLIHGDANPEGPGFKCEPVATGIEAAHVGRPQAIGAARGPRYRVARGCRG